MWFMHDVGKPDAYSTKLIIKLWTIYLNIFIVTAYVKSHDNGMTFVRSPRNIDRIINYCTDESCTKIAKEMRENMNDVWTSCDNFYGNTCDKWADRNPTPSYINNIEWDEPFKRRNAIQKKYEELLTKNYSSENSTAIEKARIFFATCTRTGAIDAENMNPVMALIRANEGWPLSIPASEWTHNHFRVQQIHEKYATDIAVSSLFVINSDYPNLYLGKPRLSIEIPKIHLEMKPETDPYKNKSWRDVYERYMVNLAQAMSSKIRSHALRNETHLAARLVIDFEEQLFHISKNERSRNQRPISIQDLQKEWDSSIDGRNELSINWLDVIRGRVKGSDLQVNADNIVILSPVNFIADLSALFQKHSVATIVNYIHWKVMDNLMKYTSRPLRQLDLKRKEELFGPHHLKRRVPLSPCITDGLKHAAHYLFAKKYENFETTKIMREIRNGVRRAIQVDIWNEDKWFDNRVTETLIDALKVIELSVDHPEWYDDDVAALDRYYEKLNISTNYFQNIMAIRKFRNIAGFDHLKKLQETESTAFKLPPTGYNELYDESNSALFPIGNLPPPTIDPQWPMAMNYARAGTAIGHEITRLLVKYFEYMFHDYSTNRTYSWADSSVNKFKFKVQAFIDQYTGNAKFQDQSTGTIFSNDGKPRAEENVADNGGVKAAFEAYRMEKTEGKIQPKILAGFIPNLTDEQLFFYAYANNWCERDERDAMARKLIDDTHSWGWIRTFLPIVNMKEFMTVFGCQPRTSTNSSARRVLWD